MQQLFSTPTMMMMREYRYTGKRKHLRLSRNFIPGLLRTFVGLLRSVDVEPSSPEDLQAVCSIERYGRGVAKISVCVGVWAITPPPGLIAVH